MRRVLPAAVLLLIAAGLFCGWQAGRFGGGLSLVGEQTQLSLNLFQPPADVLASWIDVATQQKGMRWQIGHAIAVGLLAVALVALRRPAPPTGTPRRIIGLRAADHGWLLVAVLFAAMLVAESWRVEQIVTAWDARTATFSSEQWVWRISPLAIGKLASFFALAGYLFSPKAAEAVLHRDHRGWPLLARMAIKSALLLALATPLWVLAWFVLGGGLMSILITAAIAVIGLVFLLVLARPWAHRDDRPDHPEPLAGLLPQTRNTPGRPAERVRVVGYYGAQVDRPGYDVALEGGALKSIAQIGAIHRLEQSGLTPRHVAGASGGAIIAALLAAGATSEQIWNVIGSLDYTSLLDARGLPNTGILRRPYYGFVPLLPGLIRYRGAMAGREFERLLNAELRALLGGIRDHPFNEPTFGELEERTKRELQIVATDLTLRRPVVFPRDAALYCRETNGRPCPECSNGHRCLTPDSMPIALAVRASMAIPLLFEPVRLRLHGTTKARRRPVQADLVDGGIISSFPIWLFDKDPPAIPTFGILLNEGEGEEPTEIGNILGFAATVGHVAIGGADRLIARREKARTILIDARRVNGNDFDMPMDTRVDLLKRGYRAADHFLSKFDWEQYVIEHRGGRARIPEAALTAAPKRTVSRPGVTYMA